MRARVDDFSLGGLSTLQGADRPQFKQFKHTKLQKFCLGPSISRQTIRTLWADRPPFKKNSHQNPRRFYLELRLYLRTVRHQGPEIPSFCPQFCKGCGPSTPLSPTIRLNKSAHILKHELPFSICS
jgi:hypothetical protein